MSTHTPSLRIGDVAKLVGTTPRTIRYYEEIGLLPEAPSRPSGGHRVYTNAEVERLREVMRLKELLGVTLEELKTLLAAEESRASVRAQLRREDVDRRRAGASCWTRRSVTSTVSWSSSSIAPPSWPQLKSELGETRKRVRRKIRELDAGRNGDRSRGAFAPLASPNRPAPEGACLPASASRARPLHPRRWLNRERHHR